MSLVLLASLAWAAPAERAWVFVLDGLRESEGVAAEDQQLPWLWGTARPMGTLVTGLVNRDSTQTDGAHRYALTGRRQPTGGLPWYEGRLLQRAFTPTILEAVGRARGLGTSAGYVNGNTVFMDSQGRSVYPGLAAVGAVEGPTGGVDAASDVEMIDVILPEIQAQGPVVTVLNLHEADKRGHAGRWDGYVQSTVGADAIVQRFAEEVIGPNDAVFVFADHGRHDGDEWPGHGDTCWGCRNSFLIAWGAGIAQGQTVRGGWELVDVAPTVAAVLGVELPTSRGRPILPALATPPATPAADDVVVEPRLATGADGRLHLFAQRLRDAAEGPAVVHRISEDGGKTWVAEADLPLAEGTEDPEDVRALRAGDDLVVAWRAWSEALGTWGLYAVRGGPGAWGAVEALDADVFHYDSPALAVDPDTEALHGWWWDEVAGTSDAPASLWHVAETSTWTGGSVDLGGVVHLPTEMELVPSGDGLLGTFAGIAAEDYTEGNANREIWLLRGADGDAPEVVRVTDDPDVSYWPSLARDAEGTLHLAWAARTGATVEEGGWHVKYASSADDGRTWTEPVRLDEDVEAWRPKVLAGEGGVTVAWVEVAEATHRVRVAAVVDGEAVAPATIAETDAYVEGIDAQPLDGGWLLAWHESSGTSRHAIHTARVKADGTSLDEVEDTPGTDTPPPDDRCACNAAGGPGVAALGALGALALGALRRRRR